MSRYINSLRARWAGVGRWWQAEKAVRLTEKRWRARPARLRTTEPVVISLTSYPKRFGTLDLTIKSLLTQTVAPERVLLWLGEGASRELPVEVRELTDSGLEIRERPDVRSYTKFIYALREFPTYNIAICDDDTWYRPNWLEELATPLPPGQIACHRIHQISLDDYGEPAAYNRWQQESARRGPSALNFPTGVGGILLHYDAFDPRILDVETALRFCPTADDVWLYWMGRLAGSTFVRVGGGDSLVTWRNSQETALWRTNNVYDQANNTQIRSMINRYGRVYYDDMAKWKPRV